MSTTTKKQHYVWRKYLIPWTDNRDLETGKILVYRKKPRGTQQAIEQRELMKIGFENYYYDISGFAGKDFSVYKQFIDYIQKDQFLKFDIDMDDLNLAKTQKDFIEKEVICSSEDIDNTYGFLDKLKAKDISFYQDSSVQKLLNTLKEEIYRRILFQECTISDDDLLEETIKNISHLGEADLKYEFILFFCMQYFRSPKIHDNLFKSFTEFKKLSDEFSDLNEKFYVNLITLFFAQSMALNITQNLKSALVLYENKTAIPFITGDTPIVALPNSTAQFTALYYPISPKIAVHMIVSNIFSLKDHVVTINESSKILERNKVLFENCVNEIYSNNLKVLETYRTI